MKKITLLLLVLIVNSAFAQMQLRTVVNEYLENNNWIPTNNETAYRYDTNGNLIKEGVFQLDMATNKWEKTQETLYNYNVNNKLIEEVYKRLPFQGVPELGNKTNYTYNVNNELIEILDYELVEGVWKLTVKEEIEYDSNNRPSIINEYDWDADNEVWEIDSKSTVTYNSEGKIEVLNIQVLENSNWIDDSKYTYSYDNNGKLIEEVYYEAGELRTKVEYQYDSNGNTVIKKDYDTYSNGSWGDISETTYTYDTTQLMSNFIHPFKDRTGLGYVKRDVAYINKLLISYSSDTNRKVYKYEDVTASNTDYNEFQFGVYPNPAEDFLTVNVENSETLKEINVFNFLGKKMLTTTNSKFSIQNLSKGIYLLHIETKNGKVAIKKIVKE